MTSKKQLREAIEGLCWSAGSYEDYDGDGWPVQASLQDGLLKDDVDKIMNLIQDHTDNILSELEEKLSKEMRAAHERDVAAFETCLNIAKQTIESMRGKTSS